MRAQSEGEISPIDWVECLAKSKPKCQGEWAAKLKEGDRKKLLDRLGKNDRVDLRSAGGKGAGGFLEIPILREGEKAATIPDSHFAIMLCDRLRMEICPQGARCKHRDRQGNCCNEPLDPRGKHALKCEVGRARTGRHDSIRNFCAGYHQRVTGYVAVTEQRVSAWDRVNPRTGLLEEARLDVATRDGASGRKVYLDCTVTCAHSGNMPRQRARANKDGLAASNAVDDKRERYPAGGGELIPLAFEAGGRPEDETVAYVRSWGCGLEPAERSEVIRYGWQQLSAILQTGNAEMLLSALG